VANSVAAHAGHSSVRAAFRSACRTKIAPPGRNRKIFFAKNSLRSTVSRMKLPDWYDPSRDLLLTPGRLRGLVHPARMKLLQSLQEDGPATATSLATRIGQSSGVASYHLRVLAEHGFIVEDTERGTGRGPVVAGAAPLDLVHVPDARGPRGPAEHRGRRALHPHGRGRDVPADGGVHRHPRGATGGTSTLDRSPRRGGYFASLGESLRFIGADQLLLGLVVLVVLVAVTNLLDQALFSVLIPVWVKDRLHDPTALGFRCGLSNIGALVGVLVAAWLGSRIPRRMTFTVGYLLGGAPVFFALAAFNVLLPMLVITALAGLAGSVMNPIVGAVEYERIPEHLQARVLGAVKASAWVGIPFGSLLGGALTVSIGLTATLVVTGVAMLLAAIRPATMSRWL
jgi:DNA-binding transcriptional ArsR family regulator